MERSQALNVHRDKPENIIEGKDLIALGFAPDPVFGRIIQTANQLRDKKECTRNTILEYIRMQITTEDALRCLQQLIEEDE